MEENYETILTGYPNVIPFDCTREIVNQMQKNICKIKIGAEQGTGFFCKIPFPDKNKMLKVLITNNHVINENILYKKDEKISIYIEQEKKIRELNLNNRIKYTKKKEEYDITIIEIKEEDGINNFLELDDIIINDIIKNENENVKYIDKTFYIIQYPDGDLSVSFGVILSISEDKKYKFNHKCCTKGGSSGSPILTLKNKVIGLHTGGNKTNNLGTFLNEPIKDFIKEYNNKKYNKEYKYKVVTISTEVNLKCSNSEPIGLLELSLLKEIVYRLNNYNLKKLPEFFPNIMKSLKNINIKYIRQNDSKETIMEELKNYQGNNVINFSDFLNETLATNQINELMSLLKPNDLKEINNIKLGLSKYNVHIKNFNEGFKKAKRESIFEFSLISLVIIERADLAKFETERRQCPNRIDKILFHGTSYNVISIILRSHFKRANINIFGNGVYLTDFLDFCWFYGNGDFGFNFGKIPEIGDTFSLIACSTYFDKKGIKRVIDNNYTPKKNELLQV